MIRKAPAGRVTMTTGGALVRVCLLSLLGLLALSGCGGSAPATETAAPSARAPFLWRVESPNGRVSHLMGTIHGGVTLDEALPAPHDDLLANATSVHVESLVDDPAQLMAFAQRMMQPSPVPLSQRVAAADFEALVAQLGAFPRERLDSLRPWAAFFVVLSVRLTRSLQAHAAEAGTDPAAPAMDAVVLQRTRERQLLPQPLEQMSELADIFEGLDEGVYLAMLADFAQPLPEDGSDPEAEQLAQLVAAYRAGDLDAVSTLVAEQRREPLGLLPHADRAAQHPVDDAAHSRVQRGRRLRGGGRRAPARARGLAAAARRGGLRGHAALSLTASPAAPARAAPWPRGRAASGAVGPG
mgnify:CR=1 FL=1